VAPRFLLGVAPANLGQSHIIFLRMKYSISYFVFRICVFRWHLQACRVSGGAVPSVVDRQTDGREQEREQRVTGAISLACAHTANRTATPCAKALLCSTRICVERILTMSLALMREAKRQRTGKAAADDQSNDWHVLIAAPSLTMTTVCYFGASIPCGGFVSEDEWTSFVEAHIAKRLGPFSPDLSSCAAALIISVQID
jgi:hypothetical protein